MAASENATGTVRAWIAWESARIKKTLHGTSERDAFEAWICELAVEVGLIDDLCAVYRDEAKGR